jgi:hypothetical protein
MRFSHFILIVLLNSATLALAQQVQNAADQPATQQEFEFTDDNMIVAALDSLSNLKYLKVSE